MGILSKFTDFFLPDADTARSRRIDVFGTESKAVAGTVIVGTAAAAIAAPIVIGAKGGASAVASAVGSRLASLTVPQAIGLAVAAPIAAGAIISEPKTVTRTAGGVTNFEGNLYNLGKDPSIDNIKQTFKENPIIASGVAAAGALAVGTGVSGVVATVLNTKAVKENTEASLGGGPLGLLPDNSSTTPQPDSGGSMVPLTPETQVLGREVKTATVMRKRKASKKRQSATNVRVNVLNQQTYIQGRSR